MCSGRQDGAELMLSCPQPPSASAGTMRGRVHHSSLMGCGDHNSAAKSSNAATATQLILHPHPVRH